MTARTDARLPRTLRRATRWTGALGVAAAAMALWTPAGARADDPNPPAAGQTASAAELLPASTVAYVEVDRPREFTALLDDSPLLKLAEQLPAVRNGLDSANWNQFKQVVGLIEQRANVKWRPALDAIAGDGMAVAIDGSTQGAVFLLAPSDRKTADAVRDAFFSLARQDAVSKQKPNPIVESDYRGQKYYKAGDAVLADVGRWIVLSNKLELAKSVADAALDKRAAGDAGGLSGQPDFTAARASAMGALGSEAPAAWAFVKLETLRKAGAAPKLLGPREKSDNPVVDLLAGALGDDLSHAPYLVAALGLKSSGVRLALVSPRDASWSPPERKFCLPPAGQGADAPLMPRDAVLSFSTWRDLSAFWQSAPDLFNEGVAGKMAQADSGISTFLGGKSFSGDVLGAIAPQIQLVAARQDYAAAGVPAPTIRFPAAALVLRIKPNQSKLIRKAFRLAYNSIVALANLDGASKGRPSLDSDTEVRAGAEVLYSTYEAPDKPAAPAAGKPATRPTEDAYYNASPSLSLSDDYVILSSTRQLAEELTDLAAKRGAKPPEVADSTLLHVDGQIAADLLRQNREALIARNMLEKSHDRAAAEKDVDTLLLLVGAVRDATLKVTPAAGSDRVEAELNWEPK